MAWGEGGTLNRERELKKMFNLKHDFTPIAQPGLEQYHDTVKAEGSNPSGGTMNYAYNNEIETVAIDGTTISATVEQINKSIAILNEAIDTFIKFVGPVLRYQEDFPTDTAAISGNRVSPLHASLVDIRERIDLAAGTLQNTSYRVVL